MTADVETPRQTYSILLLASDGSPAMDATIQMAHLLAARDHARVHVVTAVEPLPMVTPEGNLPFTSEVEQSRRAALEKQVLDQLARVAPESRDWAVRQIDGHPDVTIVRMAHEAGAGLIVLGLGEHGMVDRWFGGETALRVLRLADVPVLAVSPSADRLPERVLVAMDFSETSERALAAALPLLGAGAKITMAHVVPRDISMGVWPAWDDAYENAVKASFAELRGRLKIPASMAAEELVLYGDPARELLTQAERMKADLIVTGTHGHNIVARALLGRVSTKLIRGAQCSVFILPPEMRAS
ncbi:MAG: universal stress protein [Gemmatimonadota bacterium]|nr:universal stress protein [Gemmatimonadota bacterium]